MGLFNRPLSRSRLVPLAVALLAAVWFALPLLKAVAVPPDTAPIQGTGTANQDPPGSCPGRPNTITFPIIVGIEGGVLHTADPGGETSGPINPDGTAHLTGPSESYDLLSSQGTTLQLTEINGNCNFLTTIVLQQPLPPLAGGAVVPQETAASAPTTQASVAAPTAIVVIVPGATSSTEGGGRSLVWVWVGVGVLGVAAVGGGVFILRTRIVVTPVDTGTGTRVAVTPVKDCSEERRRVEEALAKYELARRSFQGFNLSRKQAQIVFNLVVRRPSKLMIAREDLEKARAALADCLGVPLEDVPREGSPPGAAPPGSAPPEREGVKEDPTDDRDPIR